MNNESLLRSALSLLSMVFLIYIGSTLLKGYKLDLTEESIYTLSEGSRSIIGKLDAPIKLKLYYSKTAANKGTEGLRAFNNHFRFVSELLKEYVANSRNNLSLEVIDPRPDTSEEEDAIAYGLKKFHLTETEKYFFGLVAENESGTEKVIEFFDPGEKDKLEYQLTKLIYQSLNPKKKSVGIISSIDVIKEDLSPYIAQIMRMQGKPVEESWTVVQMAKELYDIKKIENDTEKISGLDALVVVHPKGFSEKTLFAIDQYLMTGGKMLVLVDPNSVSSPPEPSTQPSSPDEGFAKLMKQWGIKLKENAFAGDRYLSGTGSYRPGMPPTRLLPILKCDSRCVENHSDITTAGIEDATFVFPGVLEIDKKDNIEATPILSTSDKGNSYAAQRWELNNPDGLMRKFKDGSQPVNIGYKLTGTFETAFPEGIKQDNEEKKKESKEAKKQLLKKSEKEGAIIVFSDVDFLHDQFAVRRSFLGKALANQNANIFLNSIEALTGDVALLSVRSKGRINRSFDVIDQIEFEAEKRTEDKVKEINANIVRFQKELDDLGRKANEGNIAILQNEGIKKKKELAKKIALLKSELREVKREGRERVESIGKFFMYLNTLFMPALFILMGFYIFWRRRQRPKNTTISKDSQKSFSLEPAGGKA